VPPRTQRFLPETYDTDRAEFRILNRGYPTVRNNTLQEMEVDEADIATHQSAATQATQEIQRGFEAAVAHR
jgi:hypothetical protein